MIYSLNWVQYTALYNELHLRRRTQKKMNKNTVEIHLEMNGCRLGNKEHLYGDEDGNSIDNNTSRIFTRIFRFFVQTLKMPEKKHVSPFTSQCGDRLNLFSGSDSAKEKQPIPRKMGTKTDAKFEYGFRNSVLSEQMLLLPHSSENRTVS